MYYLMDLERTIASGRVYYWKGNRHGYTTYLDEAGLFPVAIAEEIVKQDFNKRTIMIAEETVKDIIR